MRPDPRVRALVLVEKLDAGFVSSDPADFSVKPEFAAFHFNDNGVVLCKILGFGGNPAPARADIFNDAGTMRVVVFQNTGPLAPLAREDAGFFQQFLRR